MIECKWCGIEYEKVIGVTGTKYCSWECYVEANNQQAKERWHKHKTIEMDACGGKAPCCKCGKECKECL